jgi:hypothetical protein
VQKWSQRTCSHGTVCDVVLVSKQIIVLEHPPYSPDVAPNDFLLFLKIKEILKGRNFDDTDGIRINTTTALKAKLF